MIIITLIICGTVVLVALILGACLMALSQNMGRAMRETSTNMAKGLNGAAITGDQLGRRPAARRQDESR